MLTKITICLLSTTLSFALMLSSVDHGLLTVEQICEQLGGQTQHNACYRGEHNA